MLWLCCSVFVYCLMLRKVCPHTVSASDFLVLLWQQVHLISPHLFMIFQRIINTALFITGSWLQIEVKNILNSYHWSLVHYLQHFLPFPPSSSYSTLWCYVLTILGSPYKCHHAVFVLHSLLISLNIMDFIAMHVITIVEISFHLTWDNISL